MSARTSQDKADDMADMFKDFKEELQMQDQNVNEG